MSALRKAVRRICLHNTSFVYVSEVKVRLGAIMSFKIRSSAMFVYISEVKVRLGAIMSVKISSSAMFVHITCPPEASSVAIFVCM